ISKEEFESCILRTLRVCSSLNIPIDENFKQVYVSDKNELYIDLKLSALACYLLTVNGNTANPYVAKAQLFYAIKTSTNVKI
ncbi:MAG: hypothetical protein H0W84_05140, partial [Bacteroidetes bacterium]|nr:hypothetical protein [Bacteroidota bacterium]